MHRIMDRERDLFPIRALIESHANLTRREGCPDIELHLAQIIIYLYIRGELTVRATESRGDPTALWDELWLIRAGKQCPGFSGGDASLDVWAYI